MQALKSLNFTAIPKRSFDTPIHLRRAKLIARLEEQRALLDNPTFMAIDQRWEKTADGGREPVVSVGYVAGGERMQTARFT